MPNVTMRRVAPRALLTLEKRMDSQTDRRTPDRNITLSAKRGQRNKLITVMQGVMIMMTTTMMMVMMMRVGILYYVSSTLNPILYSVMSHRYRRALRDTICPSRSDGLSSRRRGCPGCFCHSREGRNGRQGGHTPRSPAAYTYELDTRLEYRLGSQRFDTRSARCLGTAAL